MKLCKLFFLFLFLSIKGFSQQAVLTSSGEKLVLNYLSSSGGTITGTLGVTGNTTISGTTTLTGINNTGTITNNGNATITGTLTLPLLSASTLIGTDGSKGVATGNLTGDITTSGFAATLTNTGVIVGTYGTSTAVPIITVDSKGRITTITTTTITASGGSTITYTIGLNPELGGYVFFLSTDNKHGLVAETQDQSTSSSWYNAQDNISNQANHSTNGKKFTDWRLPTKHELNLMYLARTSVGGFTNNYYWCSTEDNYIDGLLQLFTNGGTYSLPKFNTHYVRAIRAF